MEISEIILIAVAFLPSLAALKLLFDGYKNIKSFGAKFVLLPMLLVVLCVPLVNVYGMMGIAFITQDDLC